MVLVAEVLVVEDHGHRSAHKLTGHLHLVRGLLVMAVEDLLVEDEDAACLDEAVAEELVVLLALNPAHHKTGRHLDRT
jgi:hypothetical protein